MNEYWIGFLGSIIGGLISGGLTCLGVVLTIRHENKKRREEKKQKTIDSRPQLEVTSKKIVNLEEKPSVNVKALDAVVAPVQMLDFAEGRIDYQESADWAKEVCSTFTFENVGDTSIEKIIICSKTPDFFVIHPRSMSKKFKKEGTIYNSVSYEKHLSTHGKIEVSFFNTTDNLLFLDKVCFFLIDRNENVWVQDFYLTSGNIKSSYLSSKEILEFFTTKAGILITAGLIETKNE